MLQMTAEQLTVDMLAESEAALHERNCYLDATVRDLTIILADLAFDRCLYESLARGWLVELAETRRTNTRLREELARYTSAAVMEVL